MKIWNIEVLFYSDERERERERVLYLIEKDWVLLRKHAVIYLYTIYKIQNDKIIFRKCENNFNKYHYTESRMNWNTEYS